MADFSVNPSKDIPANSDQNKNGDSADESFDDYLKQREWKKTLDAMNPISIVGQAVGAINVAAEMAFGDGFKSSPAPTPTPTPAPKPTLTQRQIADLARWLRRSAEPIYWRISAASAKPSGQARQKSLHRVVSYCGLQTSLPAFYRYWHGRL